ncbi:hypothetical protein SAMN02910456_01456 [Ruminococcaceae bacterium YRB3002]|nr:hypothetical protein SAMN02910456_01456 [Ruminococcaceae bacterium YRB3002]
MKTITKLITVLMIAVMALGIFGCAGKTDIGELQKNRGMMLVVTIHIAESLPEEEYKIAQEHNEMSLAYDGTAYNPNHMRTQGLKVTDDDYLKIYNFCVKNAANNKFADYEEFVDDGVYYTFTYYDTDGNACVIYDGYCYENEELQDIMHTIGKYSID